MISLEFLGFPNYKVTECGKIWSERANRFLKGSISLNHHDKYEKVWLTEGELKRFITVHRIVAFTYLKKNPDKKYVNHIDGNIHNNHVSNLEWVTALENNIHSLNNVRTPQFTKGLDLDLPERGNYKERSRGRGKITEQEAIQYCEYMMLGYRGCDIRLMTGISSKMFTKFKLKRDFEHKHIAEKYDFSHLKEQRLTTPEEVVKVCEMLQAGNTIMNTYKTLELPRSVVRGIADRKNYRPVSENYVW